jgi:hypothetical protein
MAFMARTKERSPIGPTVATTPTTGDFEPIAGVSLELYAEISRDLAGVGYDPAQAPVLAAGKGVAVDDWRAAVTGWNGRMQTNPMVGRRFDALYAER